MQRGRKDDVDLDSLLESLVHDKNPAPRQQAPSIPRVGTPQQSAITRKVAPPPATPIEQNGRASGAMKKLFIFAGIILLVTAGVVGVGMWAVPNLLSARSPFSQEIQDKMGTPLYYPAKLPGTFKMETDSIAQPEPDVVLYALSDDDGKRINVTLQKQPDGLNLEPLYSVLKDVQEVDTEKFGKIKIGISDEGLSVANIVKERTWIIISGSKDTLTAKLLAEVVDGLRS